METNGQQSVLIGMDLGGTNLRAGLVSLDGEVILAKSVPSRLDEGVGAVHDRMAALAERLLMQAGRLPEQVVAIGIGSPGPLDSRTGQIVSALNLPGWDGVNVAAETEQRTGLRCFLENDAVSAAWGEFWVGAGREVRSMIMLTLGTGVGGAIILNGQVLRGPDDSAGHLGHVTVDYAGRAWPTGNRGALEAYLSATGIVRRYREEALRSQWETGRELPGKASCEACGTDEMRPDWTRAGVELACPGCGERRVAPLDEWGPQVTCAEIARQAAEGCRASLAVFEETGLILGAFLAGMANALNVEMAVIGGGVAASWDLFSDPMLETFAARALPAPGRRMRIVPAALGDDAGFLGAAGLALRRLYRDTTEW